ncbi:hypothetical protein F5880DRAFT_1482208 [Lentinula raphanica]|nr:hypothetical protein F5880DRAFT_1482208 [Lentinula raphanica]
MLAESDKELRNRAFKVFSKYPCLWQIKAARTVLEGKNVLTIAPPGTEKSFTYWLPFAFVEHGTIILVTPLKELGAQFETQLPNAVDGCKALNEIASLRYQVIIFVIDVAHVVHDWGGTFCPEYHSLGPARYALPRHIPYHLGTATLPPSEAKLLKEHLNMGTECVELYLDTDCKNIFHCIQKMRHLINSYHDLVPLILPHSSSNKFIVFFNSRRAAQEGAQFLCSHLPKDQIELVKRIHSGMSNEFHHDEVHALKIGNWLGTCATDAVGMVSNINNLTFALRLKALQLQGIDIPDIHIVVRYSVPTRDAHECTLECTCHL